MSHSIPCIIMDVLTYPYRCRPVHSVAGYVNSDTSRFNNRGWIDCIQLSTWSLNFSNTLCCIQFVCLLSSVMVRISTTFNDTWSILMPNGNIWGDVLVILNIRSKLHAVKHMQWLLIVTTSLQVVATEMLQNVGFAASIKCIYFTVLFFTVIK